MAKVVEDQPEWKAVIRCAQNGYPGVDGCFSLIEITLGDLTVTVDYEVFDNRSPRLLRVNNLMGEVFHRLMVKEGFI